MLADYGATVVHVESLKHIDTLRVIPPYQFSHPHIEGSGAFQSANANKLDLTLDLGSDAGREIALELQVRGVAARQGEGPIPGGLPGVDHGAGVGLDEAGDTVGAGHGEIDAGSGL